MEKVSELSVEGIVARLHAEGFLETTDVEKFCPADHVKILSNEEIDFLSRVLERERLLPSRSKPINTALTTKIYTRGEVLAADARLEVAVDRIDSKRAGEFRLFPHVVLAEIDDVRRVLQRLYYGRFGIMIPETHSVLSPATGNIKLDHELGLDAGLPYFNKVSIIDLEIPRKGLPVAQLDFNQPFNGVCDLRFGIVVDDHGLIVLLNDTDSGPECLNRWTFARVA
jgi:hypothetical protein